MIRFLSRFLRPYWRIVVTHPNGDQFALPRQYRSPGEARFDLLVRDLLMSDDGYQHELRRYR